MRRHTIRGSHESRVVPFRSCRIWRVNQEESGRGVLSSGCAACTACLGRSGQPPLVLDDPHRLPGLGTQPQPDCSASSDARTGSSSSNVAGGLGGNTTSGSVRAPSNSMEYRWTRIPVMKSTAPYHSACRRLLRHRAPGASHAEQRRGRFGYRWLLGSRDLCCHDASGYGDDATSRDHDQ